MSAAPFGGAPAAAADPLEQDAPIRGQRFACVSFVSPEDALASKDAYAVREFLGPLGADLAATLDALEAAFADTAAAGTVQDTARMLRERHAPLWDERAAQEQLRVFRRQEADRLDDGFQTAHPEFPSSVRGFKVRGSYDTLRQAQERGRALFAADHRFDVFSAEVGAWCPWSADAKDLEDLVQAETELNTLVKAYKDGMRAQEALYHERRGSAVAKMNGDREQWAARAKLQLQDRLGAAPAANADLAPATAPLPPAPAAEHEQEQVRQLFSMLQSQV